MKNFILTLAIVGAAFFGMTTPVKAGNYHNYWVMVITYKDHYSNNGYRDWKRPISSQKHFSIRETSLQLGEQVAESARRSSVIFYFGESHCYSHTQCFSRICSASRDASMARAPSLRARVSAI
jgi:hypothetical protein